MPSRRALLSTIGAVAAGTAGCVGRVRDALDDDPAVTGPCDDSDRRWPTAGGDAGRTGRTDTAPPASDADAVDLLAGVTADGRRRLASSLPAVGDGTAYVPTGGGVAAVSVDDPGSDPVWTRDLDADVDAVPALACGVVFVPGLNRLFALDAETGETYWQTDVGGHEATAVAPLGETVYVAGVDPVAVDLRAGDVEWRADGGDTLAVGGNGVYSTRNASGVGDVYAHDFEGEQRWHLAPGKVVGSASALDRTVYVADTRGTVYAVDATTGETHWSRSLDGVEKIHSGLAVRGDDVVVPAGTGDRSTVLDAATGETRWSVDTGIVTGRPVVGGDWVAFGRTNVGVTVYDRPTGEALGSWTREAYDLGTVDGLVPVEEGFVVRGGTTSGLTLIR